MGPFAETMLGLASLRMERPGRRALPWQRPSPAAGALAEFLSPAGLSQVDFFSTVGPAASFAEAVDGSLAMSRARWTSEMRAIRAPARLAEPGWLPGIHAGEPAARRGLLRAVRAVHRETVEPHWPAMQRALAAEHTRLTALLARGGLDALLSNLHPGAVWRSGVLEIPGGGRWSRRPLTAELDGTGLVIVPSVLCPRGPVPYFQHDGERPAVLLYPAVPDRTRLWLDGVRPGALAALLGRTRAAGLAAVAGGCSTGELARRIGVAPATASEHATVLRDAGLLTSTREGNRMRHDLTPLGAALLGDTR